MQTWSRNYLWGQRADLLRPSKTSYYHYQVIWCALMGNLTLKDRPKGLLIKSSLHVCVLGQESHSLTAVTSSFVLFCLLCWTLANLLLTDWLVDRLIGWLTDCNHFCSRCFFLLRLCSVFRVSVSASVELFSALSLSLSLSHTHTHTHNHLHTHTSGGMMLVQVYDLQHSRLLLLKRGLSVARMCETLYSARAGHGAREGAAT